MKKFGTYPTTTTLSELEAASKAGTITRYMSGVPNGTEPRVKEYNALRGSGYVAQYVGSDGHFDCVIYFISDSTPVRP